MLSLLFSHKPGASPCTARVRVVRTRTARKGGGIEAVQDKECQRFKRWSGGLGEVHGEGVLGSVPVAGSFPGLGWWTPYTLFGGPSNQLSGEIHPKTRSFEWPERGGCRWGISSIVAIGLGPKWTYPSGCRTECHPRWLMRGMGLQAPFMR